MTADEVIAELRNRVFPCVSVFGDMADAVEALQAENEWLKQYKELWQHAIDCVDQIFQEDSTIPDPILPDFLQCGADKFEGCIKLAKAYVELQANYEALKDVMQGMTDESAALRNQQVRYVEVYGADAMGGNLVKLDGKWYSVKYPPRTPENTVPLKKEKTTRERFREVCDHCNQRGTVAEINKFFDALNAAGLLRKDGE